MPYFKKRISKLYIVDAGTSILILQLSFPGNWKCHFEKSAFKVSKTISKQH